MAKSSRVSIVLTTGNQARLLDASIRSILDQDHDDVECILVDGDSSVESKQVIERYASRLSHVITTSFSDYPDAINRGFEEASGEIMGWLRANEMLCPWSLRSIAAVFGHCPEVEWLTSSTPIIWSPSKICVRLGYTDGFSRRTFVAGRNFARGSYYKHPIHRESTFWRRSLWDRSGGLVKSRIEQAGDYELWTRFWDFANLVCFAIPLGGPQVHSSFDEQGLAEAYWNEAELVMRRNGWRHPPQRLVIWVRKQVLRRLPRLASRLADQALHIEMDPEDEHCKLVLRFIV